MVADKGPDTTDFVSDFIGERKKNSFRLPTNMAVSRVPTMGGRIIRLNDRPLATVWNKWDEVFDWMKTIVLSKKLDFFLTMGNNWVS